ncbi:MAG: hypothetical protein AB7W37_16270 [Syntrophobacteraceae bacterium]
MKTATALLRSAESLGIILWVEGGQLRYKARQPVSDGIKSRIRQHKAEIIDLLSPARRNGRACNHRGNEATRTVPSWCRANCPGLEVIPLANEGEVAGCVHPVTGAWRRLDMMTECPAVSAHKVMNGAGPTLPEWCNARCEHYHRLDVPDLGTMQWCCHETDATHWRRNRIDSMTGCPHAAKEAGR